MNEKTTPVLTRNKKPRTKLQRFELDHPTPKGVEWSPIRGQYVPRLPLTLENGFAADNQNEKHKMWLELENV